MEILQQIFKHPEPPFLGSFLFMARLYPLLLIVLVLAVSGCTGESPHKPNAIQVQTNITAAPTATPRPPLIVYVDIKGSAFNPPQRNIVSGTTVQWRNQDSAAHAVRVGNSTSPPLNKRDMWNYTFNEAGAFHYNCTIHPLCRTAA